MAGADQVQPDPVIYQNWLHSYEEDTDILKIYRPTTFDFPLGWGNNLYFDQIRIGDFIGAQLAQPVAIRASDSSVCSGGSVQFEDLSPEFPTSWNWVFEGDTPAFSTHQSPVVRGTIKNLE